MAQETKKRGPGRPPGSKNKNTNSKESKSTAGKARPVTKQERISEMQQEYDRDKRTNDVIWSVTLFAVGLFLLFTVIFNTTGAFGLAINHLCIGLFGDIAYALPFVVFIYAGLLVTGKLQHMGLRTSICGFLIVINLCLLNSYRFIDENDLKMGFGDIAEFYTRATDNSVGFLGIDGGGVFGMEIGSILVKFFGKPGMIIIALTVLFICIFLVANTPISRFFDRMGKKMEERRLLKEMEEAEAEKIDSAIAAAASSRGSSKTGFDSFEDFDDDEEVTSHKAKSFWRSILNGIVRDDDAEAVPARELPEIPEVVEKPAPVKNDAPVDTAALMAEFEEPLPEQKDDSVMQAMSRNTIFGKLAQKITGKNKGIVEKEDDGDYGYKGPRSMGIESSNNSRKNEFDTEKSYGLGDPEDFGHSGSLGLDGHYRPNRGRGLEIEESPWTGSGAGAGLAARRKLDRTEAAAAATGLGAATTVVADTATGLGAVASNHIDRTKTESTPASRTRKTTRSSATSNKSVNKANTPATTITDEDNSSEDSDLDNVFNSTESDASYVFPPVSLLRKGSSQTQMMSDYQLEEKAEQLEKTLRDFGVDATVLNVTQGASVTRYEVQPATGVKVSSITRLSDDIALNLRAKSLRMEAPIPGKAAVGIEVENDKPAPVLVRELIESSEFENAKSKISFVVGKDISGRNIVANLKDMPHLLIAGATGSGKSVCINTIITSFLYKAKPSELKLIMIDPKVVELSNYNGIPHMLTPVVTDPKKAARALAIAVQEMDKRYELFAKNYVKDLESYNDKMRADHRFADVKPQVVIIIDELADLMMAAPSDVESSICRLAQKARAAGMHLIVATQRPSVDVVTGLIKANIPSRIAFSVASQIDSRTILDMAGAEKLLGKGDMLFSPVGSNKPYRVQGPFITEGETEKIIDFVKNEGGAPEYDENIQSGIESADKKGSSEPQDELTEDAIAFILKSKQASVSMLQRRFRIGYNRAARIIDEIEEKGIIGPSDGARPRQVLMTEDEYYGGPEDVVEDIIEDEIEESVEENAEESVIVQPREISNEEKNSAIDYFNSLPESVRKQILDSDHRVD